MAKLTVAHISDAHWSEASKVSQATITAALITDLAALNERDIKPDLVIFSGDLVQAGGNLEDYEKAKKAVLEPILKAIGLPIEKLFVTPGNHDISRTIARDQEVLEKGLKQQLIDRDAVSKFIEKQKSGGALELLSLERIKTFYDWHDATFTGLAKDSAFSRSAQSLINGKKVGLSLFNSAWRATGEAGDVDDGHLLIGSGAIDAAIESIADCEYKIAVVHHPFECLAQFERNFAEDKLSKNFDLICTGHTHHPRPRLIEDVFGSSVRSQAGSFYAGSRWFNGYQILQIDFVKNTTSIYCREYFAHREIYGPASNLIDADPLTLNFSVKTQSINDQIEQFLELNRKSIKDNLLEHLNFGKISDVTEETLIESYACPKLFVKEDSKLDESGNISESFKKLKSEELLEIEQNVLFHGGRQSGKTALRLYLAYRVSNGIGCVPKIPIFIDVRNFQWNLYGVRRAIKSTYDVPANFDINSAITNGNLFFFFEDIGQLDQAGLDKLKIFCENFKPCKSFVFGCPDDHSISKERHFKKTLTEFVSVGLGELTRGAIRKMTNSWFSDGQEAKANFDLVVSQIHRDGLPRSAYMVGLLLWAAKQGQKGNRLNEAILLQNVLDHLLDRANFRLAKRGALTTRGKELLLNEIANHFDANGHRARSAEVISWVDEYFGRKKLGYDASEVVEELVTCGILRKEDGYIGFRYRCFQEYYIALGMLVAEERDAKTSGMQFLTRAREIELLSGLQGENAPLIDNIVNVLMERMPRDLAGVTADDFSKVAYGASDQSITRVKLRKIRRTRLTEEQIDQVMDAIDERAAARGDKPISESLEESGGDVVEATSTRQAEAVRRDVSDNSDFLRPGTFMAGLSILARVLRNSDYTDYDKKGPALDGLLESWCRIHVLLNQEVRWILTTMEDAQDDKLDDHEFETLVNIMSKMLFGSVAGNLANELATPSLIDSIHELDKEDKLKEGKRLLSLIVLEDCDDPSWPDRWKSMIDNPKTPAFDIDVLVDRLWRSVNRKALDDDQDKRVVRVVDAIESRFDWGNDKKSSVLEHIRDYATLQRFKDD